MSNTGGSSGDVVIKLRLDTAQAEADLKRFHAGIGAATVVTGRMTGGGVPGYGPGGGGGGGLNIGGLLRGAAGAGLLGALGGADLAGGVGNIAGGLGSTFSESRGFADFRRRSGIPQAAARATVDQLGIAGSVASDDQIRALYKFNESMGTMGADAEKRIRGVVGGEMAKSYEDQVLELVKLIVSNWPLILGAFVAMRAGGGLTGALVGAAAFAVGDQIMSAVK